MLKVKDRLARWKKSFEGNHDVQSIALKIADSLREPYVCKYKPTEE